VPHPPAVLLARRLVDGSGAPAAEDRAVLFRDGRFEEVVPRAALTRSHLQDRQVVDLGDVTVLPGLIDTHVHLTFSAGPDHEAVRRAVSSESDACLALRALRNAWSHLRGGVTTMRDTGGRGFVVPELRNAVRAGLVRGPRILACGPALTTPRGHLNYLGGVADGAAALRAAARRVLEQGADFIKVCASGGIMTAESDPMEAQYTETALRGAVEEAEERGTLVAAHVLSSEALGRCIRAGVRSIEHCLWQERPGEFRFQPQWAAQMRERGIVAGLTFAGISQARYQVEVLGEPPPADLGVWQERLSRRFDAEREMIAAGVPYVLHSDAGVRETLFGEFWRVVGAGRFELELTPDQAIHAVTGAAARLLGLEDEVGEVRPGLRADILVTAGNPAERVEDLRNPLLVILGGEVVHSAAAATAAARTLATAGALP
jgi:imidazolonepropionase-like amidohydrolase